MATLERALEIACRAHAGKVDKAGEPYILHVMRVVLGCSGTEVRIVAALHDVLEDTPLSVDTLRLAGFSEPVVEAVVLLTRTPPYEYAPYIEALKINPLAREVKLVDLRDHLDRPGLTPSHRRRYEKARSILYGQINLEARAVRGAALEGE
jgi:(p)ppGpp synthase/HD superfamily hydrolase